MSKNDLNASQKKILDIITDSSIVSHGKDNEGFDFPCVNDYCSGRTENSRVTGLAWKNKNHYEIFCSICGASEKLTKEELKDFKAKAGREVHDVKSEKEKQEKEERKRKQKELEDMEDALYEPYEETSD